jgi:hypothetical protein
LVAPEEQAEDRGPLWEHLVLDVLRTTVVGGGVGYWRDKADRFDGRSLAVFRASYPRGRNVVVSPGVAEPYHTRAGSLVVRVMDCHHLAAEPSARN